MRRETGIGNRISEIRDRGLAIVVWGLAVAVCRFPIPYTQSPEYRP